MNRRGSISDVLFIGVMLVTFVIAVTIGFYVNAAFASNAVIMANPTAGNITAISTNFYCGTPDNLGLAIMFGSLVVAVMLAFLFGQNSIFKAITIIMMILFMGISVVFQIWGEEFFASSVISSLTACMPKVSFILENFVIFALVSCALIIVALFYRGGSGREF